MEQHNISMSSTNHTGATERYNWQRLNTLQVGRYAEYFVKMEFTLFGFDVYTTEVDYHGIDFVIRKDPDRYFDVQAKSVRLMQGKPTYINFPKDRFSLRDNLLAAVVLLRDHEAPDLYLIPATAWREPNALFKSYDYVDRKSKPEWGLNITQHNLSLLAPYAFETIVERL